MAKKITEEAPETQAASVPSEKEFKRLLKKLSDADAELSELKGAMGSAVERSVASHNLHTDALRVIRKYLKKNPGQAAEFKLHLDTYWGYVALGRPEDDMLETPKQRRGRMSREEPAETAEEPAEAMGHGNRAIRGGKVVSINGEDAEAEPEAATA